MDQLVSVETAKLATDKGFRAIQEKCIIKLKDGREVEMWSDALPENAEYICYLPTQTCLQKWLREEHNIQVFVSSHTWHKTAHMKQPRWTDYVADVDNHSINDSRDEEFKTYEEAMEVGLHYALGKLK